MWIYSMSQILSTTDIRHFRLREHDGKFSVFADDCNECTYRLTPLMLEEDAEMTLEFISNELKFGSPHCDLEEWLALPPDAWLKVR